MIRTFKNLSEIKTFHGRYQYLKLKGVVGKDTFGYDRYLNQMLYTSGKWRKLRDWIIIRDGGCDLGIDDYQMFGSIVVHHMNPITIEDIELSRDCVFNPNYLICTSRDTHNAIHYGDESLLPVLPTERRKKDTCPWLYP